jgi:hypothetical protein
MQQTRPQRQERVTGSGQERANVYPQKKRCKMSFDNKIWVKPPNEAAKTTEEAKKKES